MNQRPTLATGDKIPNTGINFCIGFCIRVHDTIFYFCFFCICHRLSCQRSAGSPQASLFCHFSILWPILACILQFYRNSCREPVLCPWSSPVICSHQAALEVESGKRKVQNLPELQSKFKARLDRQLSEILFRGRSKSIPGDSWTCWTGGGYGGVRGSKGTARKQPNPSNTCTCVHTVTT